MKLKLLHHVQALMDRSDWKDTPLLSQLEVLEVLDAQSQVLKGTVLPHGAANTVSPAGCRPGNVCATVLPYATLSCKPKGSAAHPCCPSATTGCLQTFPRHGRHGCPAVHTWYICCLVQPKWACKAGLEHC